MNRIDALPDNSLVAELKSIRSDLGELKARQFTGKDNLITTFVSATNITGSFTAGQSASWLVTFTPNANKPVYADLEAAYELTNYGNDSDVLYFLNDFTVDPDSPIQRFYLYFTNTNTSANLTVQIGVRSVGDGIVTWQLL